MEVNETNTKGKLQRAKKRVEELKGFYIHLTVYLAVNMFITTMKVLRNLGDGESFNDAFWDFGTFAVWLFWGIGLFFHALKVFSYNPFFSKDWEKRQIQKYMEKGIEEEEKFK